MENLKILFETLDSNGACPTGFVRRGTKRSASDLAARFERWHREALVRAYRNLAILKEVLEPESGQAIDHFLKCAGRNGGLKALTRRKINGDTVRYVSPRDGGLAVDIRPDREAPGRRVARIFDTDGYLSAQIALRPLPLQIEGHFTESAPFVDAIEKIILCRRVPVPVSAHERRAAERKRTLRLDFARETKALWGCGPQNAAGDQKPEPRQDRLETAHILRFKSPRVVLGAPEQTPEDYALSQRLSAWTSLTPNGKRTIQYAGDSAQRTIIQAGGRSLSQPLGKTPQSEPVFLLP